MQRTYIPRRVPLSLLALCPPKEKILLFPLTKANWFSQPGTRFLGRAREKGTLSGYFCLLFSTSSGQELGERMGQCQR